MRKGRVSFCLIWMSVALVTPRDVGAQPPPPLTLEAAVRTARQNSRLLEVARAVVGEAQGDLVGAALRLIYNPSVNVSAGPRLSGNQGRRRTTDYELSFSQRLEIRGQRRYRVQEAEAATAVASASLRDTQRVVDAAVAIGFFEVVAADERLLLRQEAERLASQLRDAARLRLDVGEGTALELDTAQLSLAEARRRLLTARTSTRSSRLVLAEVLAVGSADAIALEGQLPEPGDIPPEAELVARALASRADLLASRHAIEARTAAVALARAQVGPDVAVGFGYERDERDNKWLATLSVPLPLFNRHQGPVARTQATLSRARAGRDLLGLAIEGQVRRAYATYHQARDAVAIYSDEMLTALEESLDLLVRAFQAGEVSYADTLLMQQQLLLGREGYLQSRLELARAQAELAASAQLSQVRFPRPAR